MRKNDFYFKIHQNYRSHNNEQFFGKLYTISDKHFTNELIFLQKKPSSKNIFWSSLTNEVKELQAKDLDE